ncbi:MAG: DUF3565 domain-containing protein [Halothiobacillaceae bacterium]
MATTRTRKATGSQSLPAATTSTSATSRPGPGTCRPWVTTETGRTGRLGHILDCKKCDAGAPPDLSPHEVTA